MSYAVEKARAGRRPFKVLELDLDRCGRDYGVLPCAAALGVTGTAKCYRTRGTCQDPVNYQRQVQTFRFCSDVVDVPRDLVALPFIQSVRITPTRLEIGSGIGERGTVTITLSDGEHNDVGVDPYVTERSYDPEKQGSFFGRLLARNPYYLNRPLRLITGYLTRNAGGGSAWDPANAETRTYFIESISGPDPSGRVTIVAKDLLKFADDERAKAPRPAIGRLAAGIAAGDGSLNLLPVGVGDISHGTSGKIRINGEIIDYTRVPGSDTLTLTARGQNFTAAAAHNADDAVQECLVISSMLAHEVLYLLYTGYAGIDPAYIPLAEWQAEDAAYNPRQYNAVISEPTGVNQLAGEMCEQGPAYNWWDDVAALIRYRTLRPASSAALVLSDEASFAAGSMQVRDRHDLRISECWVYFGQRNPTEPLDKRSNYAAVYVLVGDGETVNKYGQPRVKEIFARFLTSSSRTFVEEIASSVIQRYDEVPKEAGFVLAPKDDVYTGDLFNALTRLIQGVDGARQSTVFQVLSVAPDFDTDMRAITALQERYVASSTNGQRILTISANELDYNLRTKHDELYAAPTGPVTVRLIVEAGVIVGSTSTSTPGFDPGDWPAGSDVTIELRGRFQGRGGNGGNRHRASDDGHTDLQYGNRGGLALRTRFPITIDCSAGAPQIWAGGGGGGASGGDELGGLGAGRSGGGGAGFEPGLGRLDGTNDGTTETGGPSLSLSGGAKPSGAGGGPGEDGGTALSGAIPGGVKGDAIDGLSFITFVGTADIRGPQI